MVQPGPLLVQVGPVLVQVGPLLVTLTRGQISKKNFEVGPEVVQVGPLLVYSNISRTDIYENFREISNFLNFEFKNPPLKKGHQIHQNIECYVLLSKIKLVIVYDH